MNRDKHGKKKGGEEHLQPYHLLLYQSRQVTAPVAARPSYTLLQELGVVFEGRLDFSFGMVLEVGLPAVSDHPSREKIIVVGVQFVASKPPLLVGESQSELSILQYFGTVRNGPTRQTGHPAIHMRRSGAVEISTF